MPYRLEEDFLAPVSRVLEELERKMSFTSDDDYQEFYYTDVVRHTAAAVIFDVDDEEVCIPVSQIMRGFVPDEESGPGRTWITKWIAEKVGL